MLILFVVPQVVLYAVASLGVAAQQSQGRFALAGAPAVESIGTIVTVAMLPVIAAGHWLLRTFQPDQIIQFTLPLGVGALSVAAYGLVLRTLVRRARVG